MSDDDKTMSMIGFRVFTPNGGMVSWYRASFVHVPANPRGRVAHFARSCSYWHTIRSSNDTNLTLA